MHIAKKELHVSSIRVERYQELTSVDFSYSQSFVSQ